MNRLFTAFTTACLIAGGAVALASDSGNRPEAEGVTNNQWKPDATDRTHTPNGNACTVSFDLGPGAEVHLTGPVCPSASPTNVPGWWDRIRNRFNPQT